MVSSCLLILARLACSDATCEMSHQPTLAKFGFRKSIEHRGSQGDINLPDFVAKTQKKFTCSTCSKAFVNQQGLSVHEKCVHGVVAEGKILAKSSHSTPKTESENEIQRAVSSTMDKILSLVAEESSNSEKGNACTCNSIYLQCNISFCKWKLLIYGITFESATMYKYSFIITDLRYCMDRHLIT